MAKELMQLTEPMWRQLVDDSEQQLVHAIKEHLRTPDQRTWLSEKDLTIENVLNGEYPGEYVDRVSQIYRDWNHKLDWNEFTT